MQRTVKLESLTDAAARVADGDRVALGGFAIYQRPMAFARELVRQKRRDLTIIGVTNAIETDLLVGAGCVSCIESSYVGLERYGLARNIRRAIEAGTVRYVDFPELIAWDRFRADQEGLPYWPCTFLGGADLVRLNSQIRSYKCPLTGRPMWAIPPAQADVVVLHVPMADKYGNAALAPTKTLPQGLDVTLSRSSNRLILTADRIVETAELSRKPWAVEIPAFRVEAVVEAPFGTHPTATLGICDIDDAAFRTYADAAARPDDFASYLETELGDDHIGYLNRQGIDRLMRLRDVELA
jgi:glutaconate CoA-transferase subunit A